MGKCVIRLFVEYESDRVGGIGTLGLSSASPGGCPYEDCQAFC